MIGAEDLPTLVVALAFLSWVTYDFSALLGAPAERALWCCLAGVGLSELVHVHAVYTALEHYAGPGWGTVIFHLGNLIIAMSALDLLHLLQQRSQRTRLISLAGGLAVMVSTLAPWIIAAPRQVPLALRGHLEFMDASWQSLTHWGALLPYLIAVTVASSHNCWRNAHRADADVPHHVRTGMILISASGAVMTVVFLAVAIEQIAWFTPWHALVASFDDPLHSTGSGIGLMLLALGATWSKLTEVTHRQVRRIHNRARPTHARVQTLRPHWTTLIAACPGLSPFAAAVSTPTRDPHQLRLQQQRLVTEIHDARWQLSAHLHPRDHQRIAAAVAARGLPAVTAAAVTEHTAVLLALHRARAGAAATGQVQSIFSPTSDVVASACQLTRSLRRFTPHADWAYALAAQLADQPDGQHTDQHTDRPEGLPQEQSA